MKTNRILAIVLATLALAACQKENINAGKLQLVAEGMDGNAKMAIRGNSSYWVDDERVHLNGDEYTITANSSNGGSAYVNENVTVTTPYCGVYPASIFSSNSDLSYTLTLPAEYTYATTTFNSQTVQNLASPMVAYADGGTQLYFKHVTAAINVQVVNYHYDYDIVVDSIEVSSNSYKLNGSVTINMEDVASGSFVAAQSGSTDAEKMVKMKFGGGLIVASGDSTMVQVPVLPVGDGNKFTVKIAIHRYDQPSVTAILNRTQTTGGALARAYSGYARYTLGGPFSVAADKKVLFSKGNLQYNADATTWRFAEHQYDYIGSDNSNIADDYDGWIDLFGWGTGDAPTKHTTTASDYSTFNEWGTAASGNIGSGWYTLSKDEWQYMTTGSRTNKTFNLPATGDKNQNIAKYVKATITVSGNSYTGLILFPDYYVQPDGVTMGTNTATYNGNSSMFSQYVVSSGWEKMEFAGAVFLPLTGYRSETTVNVPTTYGLYWTNTTPSNSITYSLAFYNSNLAVNNYYYGAGGNYSVFRGHAVRLVRNVN